jgi:LPS sulfotransferase NodH
MQRFVIIAEMRSGYQWLISLLNSHPQILCLGEIFNVDAEVRRLSLFGHPIPVRDDSYDPISYLEDVVEREAGRRKAKAFGFKVNYTNEQEILWPYFEQKGWLVVHLTRRNLLDRLLSEMLAIQEQNWSHGSYRTSVEIPFDELRWRTEQSWNWQKKTRESFRDVFEVEYEQLPQIANEVVRRLGLPEYHLVSKLKKQHVQTHSRSISNYRQLLETAKSSPYRIFFHETLLL